MANITTQDEAWQSEQAIEQAPANPSAWDRIRAFVTGPYPTLVSRLVLGGILLLAGLTKIGVPETMATSIRAYEIPLPAFLVSIMSYGLPILEVGLGAWLILGLFTRLSGAVSAVLMAIFTIAITSAWLRGLDISCGCFAGAEANSLGLGILRGLGPIGTYLADEKANLETILRDVVLVLMGVHLVFVPTIFSLDRLRQRAIEEE
ncbi:MAG: MauE/DoxX family redox-associated membrane protein [Chloroflexia bacterium]